MIEIAVKSPFQEVTQNGRQNNAGENRRDETTAYILFHKWPKREGHVGTDHVEAAMRQVDDAHDAEDERKPTGNQEEQQPVLDSVQTLNKENDRIHMASFSFVFL
jgi:hypothetical protein